MSRRGLLIILSSPSGAGKSTLAGRLRAWDDTLQFSVSATTRAPRDGEVDGQDYFFVSVPEFQSQVADSGRAQGQRHENQRHDHQPDRIQEQAAHGVVEPAYRGFVHRGRQQPVLQQAPDDTGGQADENPAGEIEFAPGHDGLSAA